MGAPVVVYPTRPDVTDGDHPPEASAGVEMRGRYRVAWHYTVARPEPSCAFCAEGWCEQRVESSPGWRRDVVIHGRPRAGH